MKKLKNNLWQILLLLAIIIAIIGAISGTYFFIKNIFEIRKDLIDLLYGFVVGPGALMFCIWVFVKTLISISKN